MADEQTTDVTNSADQAATQTVASATEDQVSSATTANDGGAPDPLDGASALGDAPPALAEGNDGEDGGDTGGEAESKDGGETEAPALTGAPEGDYDLTGLMPEGVAVDTEALTAIAPLAKELNLSNAGLAKLAEQAQPIAMKQAMAGIVGDVVRQRAEWAAATRTMIEGGKDAEGNAVQADPAFGGQPYDAVIATSAKALDRFGGPGFREFLKETGLGNDPRMVMFAYKAGAAISEDSDFQRGGNIPNTPKTREEKYYGSSAA